MTDHENSPSIPPSGPSTDDSPREFRTVEPEKTVKAAKKELSPAAKRAIAEAEERRRKMDDKPQLPKEFHGREGPEPTRYGDWEKDGIISDF